MLSSPVVTIRSLSLRTIDHWIDPITMVFQSHQFGASLNIPHLGCLILTTCHNPLPICTIGRWIDLTIMAFQYQSGSGFDKWLTYYRFDKGKTVSLASYMILIDLVAKSRLSSGSVSKFMDAVAAKDWAIAIRAIFSAFSCAFLLGYVGKKQILLILELEQRPRQCRSKLTFVSGW